jgi:hypothetical protein
MPKGMLWVFLAGLVLAGCAAVAPGERGRPDVAADLKAVHLQSAKVSNATCLQCHSGLVSRASTDAVTPTFHYLHVERPGQTCGSCHTAVNIAAQRPAPVVAPQLCNTCHQPFQKAFEKR